MATATLLTSFSDGWDTASDPGYTSAAVTPGANCALVLLQYAVPDGFNSVFEDGGASPGSVISSGAGPTWTKTSFANIVNGFDTQTCIHTATVGGTDPGSFTVTIHFRDNRPAGQFAYGLYRITGHDTTTPFAGAITTTRTSGTGNGAQSVTLLATPASADIVLAISGADTSAASDAVFDNTARTWTRDATGGTSGHQIAFAIGQSTGSTSTTVAWSDVNEDDANNFASAQAAIIVVAGTAAAAGSASILPRHKRNSLLRR